VDITLSALTFLVLTSALVPLDSLAKAKMDVLGFVS
jgi:hypothetical protein